MKLKITLLILLAISSSFGTNNKYLKSFRSSFQNARIKNRVENREIKYFREQLQLPIESEQDEVVVVRVVRRNNQRPVMGILLFLMLGAEMIHLVAGSSLSEWQFVTQEECRTICALSKYSEQYNFQYDCGTCCGEHDEISFLGNNPPALSCKELLPVGHEGCKASCMPSFSGASGFSQYICGGCHSCQQFCTTAEMQTCSHCDEEISFCRLPRTE